MYEKEKGIKWEKNLTQDKLIQKKTLFFQIFKKENYATLSQSDNSCGHPSLTESIWILAQNVYQTNPEINSWSFLSNRAGLNHTTMLKTQF